MLLTNDGGVKLADFGISRNIEVHSVTANINRGLISALDCLQLKKFRPKFETFVRFSEL